MSEVSKLGERLGPLLKDVPPERMAEVLGSALEIALPEALEAVIEKARPIVVDELRSALKQGLEQLGYSEEVLGLVRLLAAKTDDSKEEALRKALTLYGLAIDAREKGNRMAILSPEDLILHEVVGFEPVGGARQ